MNTDNKNEMELGKQSDLLESVKFNANQFCQNVYALIDEKNSRLIEDEKKLNKGDIEELCGMYKGFLSKLKGSATLQPNAQQLINLSMYFNCPIDTLLKYEVHSDSEEISFIYELLAKLENIQTWQELEENEIKAFKGYNANSINMGDIFEYAVPNSYKDIEEIDRLEREIDELTDEQDRIDSSGLYSMNFDDAEYDEEDDDEHDEDDDAEYDEDRERYNELEEEIENLNEELNGIVEENTQNYLRKENVYFLPLSMKNHIKMPVFVKSSEDHTVSRLEIKAFHSGVITACGDGYYCMLNSETRIDLMKIANKKGEEDYILMLTKFGKEFTSEDVNYIVCNVYPICNTYEPDVAKQLENLYKRAFKKVHIPPVPKHVKESLLKCF